MAAGGSTRFGGWRGRVIGRAVLSLALLVAISAAAPAEIIRVSDQRFEVSDSAPVAAPAAGAFAAIADVGRWWSPDHTYSGDAANLRIDLTPGGCFRETLMDGGASEV